MEGLGESKERRSEVKMPKGCLDKICIECEWHVMRGRSKLDCNYLNRLGLSKTGMETYMTSETEEERLKRKIKAARKAEEEATKELKKIEEAKETTEEPEEKKSEKLST